VYHRNAWGRCDGGGCWRGGDAIDKHFPDRPSRSAWGSANISGSVEINHSVLGNGGEHAAGTAPAEF